MDSCVGNRLGAHSSVVATSPIVISVATHRYYKRDSEYVTSVRRKESSPKDPNLNYSILRVWSPSTPSAPAPWGLPGPYLRDCWLVYSNTPDTLRNST